MRYGLIFSIVFHVVVFGVVIFNFVGTGTPDATPPPQVAVQIMSPAEFSERQTGKSDGKADKPATPPAEVKVPETQASVPKEAEVKPAPKPIEKAATPPPPAAAEAPPPVPPVPKPSEQAKTEKTETPPKKPVQKTAAKPAPKKEPERKVAAKPKAAEDAPKQAEETSGDYQSRIASLLQHDKEPGRTSAATPASAVPPSRNAADRQMAVIDRSRETGGSSGDYDPNKPWHPASSLDDQAMGLSHATGSKNAASDAEVLLSQISQHWDLPAGAAGAESTVITIHFRLRQDGSVAGDPEVVNYSSDPVFAAASDAAKRAILSAQPFRFPAGRYQEFRDNTISFDPSAMYGAGRG